MTNISKAAEKMIRFYDQNISDINHFMKVWAFASLIGKQEALDPVMQETLELAAIVHDIACPLCREKYGSTAGIYQEKEGMWMAEEFYQEFDLPAVQLERIIYLVGHHHTYQPEGMDYQILLEADFLVNAGESETWHKQIDIFKEKVFRTHTDISLLENMYDK